MSVMAVQPVKMVTANMLLSVFFVSGALAACLEDADIFITAPQQMEALSGSCLHIPCNFSADINAPETFDSTRTTYGVWLKEGTNFANNPQDVIFNSSLMNNIYPVNITGDLLQKNCTTLFSSLITDYTNTYFFRIENTPFLATASCNPLQITVTDSPPSPRIEISGNLTEKESVTITCSASTPCPHSPPELTWTLQQDPHNTREENTDQTFTTKIRETITLSDQHDGLNITCSARYPVNEGNYTTAEERKTLSVSYAPKDTSVSISPSGLLSVGSWVNLTCSSRAKPPVSNFTWFKNSKDGPISVSEGDFYSFNVTSVTDKVYFCVATNDLGSETSSEIHLNIKEDSSLPLGAVLGGIAGIIILICLVICVWRLKSTHPAAQKSQSQTVEEMAVEEQSNKTEQEDIHYGEIDFSMQRPQLSSDSVQDSGQQQDTLYAQVKVSETANSITQTAEGPEDLYAQVKKK